MAVYLLVQSTAMLAAGYHPRHSVPGIIWTAVTAAAMFALAAGKARTGRALDNPVLRTEGRVTMIDGILNMAAQDDVMREHLMTLFKGMQMAKGAHKP